MRRENVEEFIGDTPLLRMKHLEKELGLSAQLYAKMECYNLTGSAKDRAALYMILDAEERGVRLRHGRDGAGTCLRSADARQDRRFRVPRPQRRRTAFRG